MCPNVAIAALCCELLKLGPLVFLFWSPGDVSSRFQRQSGFCFICILESNIMHITWDPPLMLSLLASWKSALWDSNLRQQSNVATYWHTLQALAWNWTPDMHRSAQVLTILNCFRDSVREIRRIPRVWVLQSAQPYERHHKVYRQRARCHTGSR